MLGLYGVQKDTCVTNMPVHMAQFCLGFATNSALLTHHDLFHPAHEICPTLHRQQIIQFLQNHHNNIQIQDNQVGIQQLRKMLSQIANNKNQYMLCQQVPAIMLIDMLFAGIMHAFDY